MAAPRSLAAWVPRWWAGEAGAAGRFADAALWPAEALYRGITAARNAAYDHGWLPAERAAIPVVSVGNIGVGGAGKTPFAAWLVRRLQALGARPAVVLRGYGGDEVLLHRELNPGVTVVAAPRRAAGVAEARAAGCTVAVLDDAFQHRALARELDVVLVSAEAWGPRRRLLPRGPWREGIGALRRAQMAGITRKAAPAADAERVAREVAAAVPGIALFRCHLAPSHLAPLHPAASETPPAGWLSGREVLALAALADPAPFARNLADLGARVELAAFADHHPFTPADAATLVARAAGRPLVTTHKDAVKLRPLLPPGVPALVLHQQVEMEAGAEALDAALRALLAGRAAG